jgi:hypothetical protein
MAKRGTVLILICLLFGAVAGSGQNTPDERCVVEGLARFACTEKDGERGYQAFFRVGARSRTEALPGQARHLQLGSLRDVVLVGGGAPLGEPWPADGFPEGTFWTRLVGLNGPVLSAEGPRLRSLAETGDWLATQVIELAPADTQDFDRGISEPWASSEDPLIVYRWDGREVRRLPGLRVFERYPEDYSDEYGFSADGRAIAVYREKRRTLELYGLDGVLVDETLDLEELTPGFAPKEFAFIDADRIVMWQPEFFGRNQAEWLRVLTRGPSGQFVSTSITHRDGYIGFYGVARNGFLLLSGPHGFDVVDSTGRLVWRLDRTGWAEILDLVTELDLRRWRPTLLPEGALRLRDTRSATVGMRKDHVIVRFGGIDMDVREEWNLTERVVVGAETRPLAEVSAVAVLPADAGVDGAGRYMLVDRAVGPEPLKVIAARGVAEP